MKHYSVVEECKLLQRQWRFEELHQKLAQVSILDPQFNTLQYIRFETYLMQMDHANAAQLYKDMIGQLAPDDPLFVSFNLRHLNLRILTYEQDDFDDAENYFESIQNDPDSSDYNKALAYSLQGKTLNVAISLGLKSALEKHRSLQLTLTAAALYAQHGDDSSAAKEFIFLAEQYKKVPFPNRPAARDALMKVLALGDKNKDHLLLAEAQTALLELNIEDAYNSGQPGQAFKPIIRSMKNASLQFQNGGHLLPNALVKERFGLGIMKYGVKEGIDYLLDAIDEYHHHSFFTQEQRLHRQIATWHLEHGNSDENAQAETGASDLDQTIGINMGSMVSYLALIERAFRAGRIGEARKLYDKAVVDYQYHPLYGQLLSLQANSLGKVGLTRESIELFRKVVAFASPLEVSAFLSDAFTNLAANLKDESPQEAQVLIKKAIAIDEQLGDNIAMAQHTQLLTQILIKIQLDNHGMPLVISAEIENCFLQCEEILKDDRSLKSFTVQAQNMQARAFALFHAGDYKGAMDLYEAAGEIFYRYDLDSNLAFLYSHMSITLIAQARNEQSIERYEKVRSQLYIALGYFETSGLKEEQARVLGLIAISATESGRLEHSYENAMEQWKRAQHYYKQSYQISRFLRINSDSSTPLSRQLSMIAFVNGSQTYTEQAFYMHLLNTKDTAQAINWLEKMKGQALVSALERRNATTATEIILEQSDGDLLNEQDQFEDVVTDILKYLPENVLIVQYYYVKDRLYIFGMRTSWPQPEMVTQSFDLGAFQECIDMHFSTDDGNVRSMLKYNLEGQWQAYRSLITPVEAWCSPREQVCFIPHGVLHQLPLHTLKTAQGTYLIERNPVFYNQSLSILLYLAARKPDVKPDKQRNNFVFGNSRSNLRFAAEEIGRAHV